MDTTPKSTHLLMATSGRITQSNRAAPLGCGGEIHSMNVQTLNSTKQTLPVVSHPPKPSKKDHGQRLYIRALLAVKAELSGRRDSAALLKSVLDGRKAIRTDSQ